MSGGALVLAFSGGLDTAYCLHTLVQAGWQVHTVFVDTGGVSEEDKAAMRSLARQLGACEHHELDGAEAIWQEIAVPLVQAGARMRGAYPLLCSDRYLIVRLCLQLCDELGTRHFAHGCTAMGNDQFRFDQTVLSLGEYSIHAPVRDLQDTHSGPVRAHELAVLAEAGVVMSDQHRRYSINENVLGVTLSGGEIDAFEAPDESARLWVRPRAEWPETPGHWTIGFERGEAVSLNGHALPGIELLQRLNRALGGYGCGRHIYTGDVSVGLKGRIVFECPGIDGLMAAHRALEDAVNTRWQNEFRDTVSARWAELVYQGYFHDPHKTDLEAYLRSAQSHLTGEVLLQSHGGEVLATAVSSPFLIHDENSVYAQSAGWSAQQAIGFIRLSGQCTQLANRIRRQA